MSDIKNEIIMHNDYAEMKLYNIDGMEIDRCKISLDKLDLVGKHRWAKHSMGYVTTNIGKSVLLLHRLITDCPKDMEVDHINRDRLDFRNENLRVCHPFQNSINKNIGVDNSSGVVGVSYDSTRKKWMSRLGYDSDVKFRKRFESFDNAVIYRLKGESKYFKEFSPNYNPMDNVIELEYVSKDDQLITYIVVDMDGRVVAHIKE